MKPKRKRGNQNHTLAPIERRPNHYINNRSFDITGFHLTGFQNKSRLNREHSIDTDRNNQMNKSIDELDIAEAEIE